jgi:hypothetical protein
VREGAEHVRRIEGWFEVACWRGRGPGAVSGGAGRCRFFSCGDDGMRCGALRASREEEERCGWATLDRPLGPRDPVLSLPAFECSI